jgi:murein DD-endopeptidase MepM/ murein hydrolase activator NlpD
VKRAQEPGAPDENDGQDGADRGGEQGRVEGAEDGAEKAPQPVAQYFQDPGEDVEKIDDPDPPWLSWFVARRQTYRRRKKTTARASTSLWLGAVLVSLTAINVYVFFFRADTSVHNLMSAKPGVGKGAAAAAKSTEGGAGKPGSDAARAGKLAMLANLGKPTMSAQPGSEPTGDSVIPPVEGTPTEGTIGDNDTLGAVIDRVGLGAAAPQVLRALSRLHDPKSIRPGDGYTVTFTAEGVPTSFEYRPSPILRYVITPGAAGVWIGRREEKPIAIRTENTGGSIDSSLYESVAKAGEGAALAGQLVELFAWDINFFTDSHPGDRWRMVVEKQYLDGKFYRYGNILSAEYAGRTGTFRAFAWSSATGHGPVHYFDEKGQAITKSFLKTPLRFVRVSSKFDKNRFHPVLHVTKAHLGVDYAAPTGTPVWASATGKVVECAMKPGSGKTVVIEHGGGLATRYYHLSKFAAGMRAGRQVRQKEIIGYVGTTGLSTGPHLHFALTRNGVFVDPAKMQVVREAAVPDRAAFLAAIKPHLAAMAAFRPGSASASASASAPAVAVTK